MRSEITVILGCCQESVAEKEVEFIDVEEGLFGEDILTFKCPKCGEEHRSRRYG